ncbi:MAG: DNA internalization-related competence protein ComEC/Rec2 [Clostridiales bacterium]|jgi:competence protein ComEC|nr:DNA internalization-related competence protein ComEC/Rec2 [Eubacteriales bacterium]MDH7566662.1 DNA internalization-related competence protein ComEC/Rec2 [Clostridiales bacterium]
MRKPLILFALAQILGILSSVVLNSYPMIILPVFGLAFLSALMAYKIPENRYVVIGIFLFYAVGAFEYRIAEDANINRYREFSGSQVMVRGYVASDPDIREAKVNYVIVTREIIMKDRAVKVRGKVLLTTLKEQDLYGYGREIQISGQLNIPQGPKNPGAFDYRRYLAGQGVTAVIFAAGDRIIPGREIGGTFPVRLGLELRHRIVDTINQSLPPQQAGLLNGMLIGYKEGLTKEVQEAFSDAGLSHIMAVSGANIAFIMMPLVFLFKKLRMRQKAANAVIILILLIFVTVTGFSPSVMRAAIMAIVVLCGQMMRREAEVVTSLSFASVLLLLYNPYTLFDIGFQLSFAATLSIVLFYKNIKRWLSFKFLPAFVVDILAVTLAVQAGVMPITAFYFNKVSIISLASNILVVPVVQFITILGAGMAVLGQAGLLFSRLLGYVNTPFLSFVLLVSKVSASFPFAVVKTVTPPGIVLVLYYGLILFLLWYKPLKGIKLKPAYYAVAGGAVLTAFCLYMLIPKGLEVYFIDVGEGDSALIRTGSGRTVLIDGGGSSDNTDSSANIGESVVIPFLLDHRVAKLDLVVATHGHSDHIQGLIPVLRDFRVENFVMPDIEEKKEFKTLLRISAERGMNVAGCKRGDTIKLDNETYFDVLYPSEEINQYDPSLNNSSIVLKLHYKEIRILFTGDIEEEEENLLLKNGVDVGADVLKVAHHGSSTSTTPAFLDAVKPAAAVISVGRNTFGHPSEKVLEELKRKNVKLFRTDKDGAIMVVSDGRKIKIRKTLQ